MEGSLPQFLWQNVFFRRIFLIPLVYHFHTYRGHCAILDCKVVNVVIWIRKLHIKSTIFLADCLYQRDFCKHQNVYLSPSFQCISNSVLFCEFLYNQFMAQPIRLLSEPKVLTLALVWLCSSGISVVEYQDYFLLEGKVSVGSIRPRDLGCPNVTMGTEKARVFLPQEKL